MKKYQIVIFILLILIADQALKFYIKTNYFIGQEHLVAGNWFRLHFVENEGMAWGWKFGEAGGWGKLALTVFRLGAVIFGVYYINKIINKKYSRGFIICVGLIFAGAFGNLIDSLFYGIIFENSDPYMQNVAKFLPSGGGYGSFLHGKVVDMLYFPVINSHYPQWVPWVGGKPFEFFSPVFNIADASISTGLIIILLFQKRFFKQQPAAEQHHTIETKTPVNDESQIL
ncbi:MAG: lipoprotein signal peptidase [Chitinophagaceae bacterium]